MRTFHRRPRVPAELAQGFHATEALALQTAVCNALTATERGVARPVPVDLVIDAGRGTRLVVVCRNLVVGFVPEAIAVPLAEQRRAVDRALLVTRGWLFRDQDLWRVWVGDVPEDGIPEVPAGLDQLPAPQPTILGVPLRRMD